MCKVRSFEVSPPDLAMRRAAAVRPSPMKPRLPRRVVPRGARINLNEHWDALEEAYLQREAMRSAVTARLIAQRAYRSQQDEATGATALSPAASPPHCTSQKAAMTAFASDTLPTVSFVLHAEQKERLSRTLNALLRISKERKS